MPYDFAGLSPADFEDLVRDLVGRELGMRFEAFAAGPDGGMDGRHAMADKATILQAKHYIGSSYATLKSKMKRERASIDRLAPARYILTTSRALSARNKHELAEIIGPALRSEADIFGPGDLNALLRKYPDVEKAHLKLWLTGFAILERVIRSAAYTLNKITREEIETKVRVYAPNPSFNEAWDTLEAHHVVIISGPPGVGKTTLAEMLCYAYIAEGWELIAIRSLDDGLASIDDSKKQIFFFDDFLGKVALDQRALAHTDSDLTRFIKRVRASPNARFILTTRAYIFEEARRVSEHLADRRVGISRYILDVGVYTRRIKARILYNHLIIAATPKSHIAALVKSDRIPKIVDHKNYNPRIIEWMTDITHIESLKPDSYPVAFIDALTHPGRLWDIAFRTHISKQCQHLLFALFFSSEYGVSIENLRVAYEGLHPYLSAKYSEPHDPKDFEEALHILEGSFITIAGKHVRFINPSLRDYLTEYLNMIALLRDFAAAARQAEWGRAVWQHGERLKVSDDALKAFALMFVDVAAEFVRLPIWERVEVSGGYAMSPTGLSNTDRIELLLDWWEATHDERFADLALALAHAPVEGGLDSWRDGKDSVELLGKLRDGDYFSELPCATELADGLEEALLHMIDQGMPIDELENISYATEEWRYYLGDRIGDAVAEAIRIEINEVGSIVADIDSESTLTGHIETLQKLATRAAIPPQIVEKAVDRVKERIREVEEEALEPKSPSFRAGSAAERDAFDDIALKTLFQPLLDL
jgi:DNA polymerase III delta prime subunit